MGALSKKHLFSTVWSVGLKVNVKVLADQDLVRPAPRFPDGRLLVAPSHGGQRSKLSVNLVPPALILPACLHPPACPHPQGRSRTRATAEPAPGCTPAGPPQGPMPLEAGPAPPPLRGSVRGDTSPTTGLQPASDLCTVIRCTPRRLGQQSRVLRNAHIEGGKEERHKEKLKKKEEEGERKKAQKNQPTFRLSVQAKIAKVRTEIKLGKATSKLRKQIRRLIHTKKKKKIESNENNRTL
ncbi:unnamed protein product [Nyctereutes procyonoides]|uniref:(raccoon dog) hypothetical protein n=1 Tax=Nyctereutes procyonoides TaxID=34880 RepID=A0A811YTB6_NYCPR|nr:unnamed protein product [Nyctereutes procyonoides]